MQKIVKILILIEENKDNESQTQLSIVKKKLDDMDVSF